MARMMVLLGAAVAMGTAPAPAFERPRKEPDAKVQTCPEVGEGYVRVPGSDTCLKLDGLVRTEAVVIKGSR